MIAHLIKKTITVIIKIIPWYSGVLFTLNMIYPGWPVGPTFPYFLIQSPTFPYFLGKQPYYPYFLGCHVVRLNKEHLKHIFLHWFLT